MFEKFYEQDQAQIAAIVNDYLSQHFFSDYPELETEISVAISGSVALGFYDSHSDIDLDFYCNDLSSVDIHKDKVASLKKRIHASGLPLQIHRLKDIPTITKDLQSWAKDHGLRELNQSLVVHDPSGKFSKLQQQFAHYPDDILHEKIQWLFAQLIFEYEEHYKISIERADHFFNEVTRLAIIRLAGNLLLLSHNQWIAFDKHLVKTLENSTCSPGILSTLLRIIDSFDNASMGLLINSIETDLVTRGFIQKETSQYWIDLRPKHYVELS